MSDGSDGGTDDPDLKDIGDGLKYRDLKEGTGEPVKPGRHVDGPLHRVDCRRERVRLAARRRRAAGGFSSSPRRDPGWKKGIPGMKAGGIRKLVIPPALGYGDQRPAPTSRRTPR